jgi:bla regulator protein blaR1
MPTAERSGDPVIATLARASIDGALLVAIVWVLSRVLRLSPATRTVLWWCAAAKFVVALAWTTPIAIPILPAKAAVVQAAANPSVYSAAAAPRVARAAAPSPRGITGGLREWSSFAAIGWTVGLVAVAAVGVRRWRDTARMRECSEPAPADVQALAGELAARLGLRRVPEVRTSTRVETPLVTGLVRPVVLLPSERFSGLTGRQQQMALCHELAHLKRADLWLGCVPAIAERVFFFHPLVHLASREYALWREAACDAAVVETLDAAPQEYGRLLLALGVSQPRPGFTVAGAAWSFLNLKRRIAMLQDVSARSRRSRLVAAGVVGLAVCAMVPMQLAARPSRQGAQGGKTRVAAQEQALDEQPLRGPAAGQQTENRGAAPQAEPGEQGRDFSFILLTEGHPKVMSGPSTNLTRARQQMQGRESLLWLRYNGREYVIREPELLRQVRALWTPVHDSGAVQEAMALAQAFKADELAEHSKLLAEQGMLGAHLGALAAEKAAHALAQAHLVHPEIDSVELERHTKKLEESTQHMDEKMRDLEHQLKQSFEGQMRDFDLRLKHDLEAPMREFDLQITGDLEVHMRELEQRLKHDLEGPFRVLEQRLEMLEGPLLEMAAPMEAFGRQMEAFGHSIDNGSRHATDEMRALIDRAIASGLAQVVR